MTDDIELNHMLDKYDKIPYDKPTYVLPNIFFVVTTYLY